MELQDVAGGSGTGWIDLAQDSDRWRAFVNAVVKLLVAKTVGKYPTGCVSVSVSRRTLLHGVSSLVS